mmetsp:Transcript_20273/g.71698  ORF Transcript_20273/g.71698 Transcript_20273/m.71698 type:complete len:394 (-) Transcript_20273:54-1235(-)
MAAAEAGADTKALKDHAVVVGGAVSPPSLADDGCMEAAVLRRFGDPRDVRVERVRKPTPKAGEVLIRVQAAGVHPDLWHTVTGSPYVFRCCCFFGCCTPKAWRGPAPILGTEVAGVVEAVGNKVTRWRAGDEVFGEIVGAAQWRFGGAFAEYVCVPEGEALARKPARVSWQQAATVGTSASIALRSLVYEAELREGAGQRVLINGAGGCLGLFAIQVAKAYGATVTGVDCAAKAAVMARVGADATIDYERSNPVGPDVEERYDIIMDIASVLDVAAAARVLTPAGRIVVIGHDGYARSCCGSLPSMARKASRIPSGHGASSLKWTLQGVMDRLAELMEAGSVVPLVDREYGLDGVADAMTRMRDGDAVGKGVVVLTRPADGATAAAGGAGGGE